MVFLVCIIQKDKKIMLAVDKTRTFPLLYIDNENELIISDDSYFLRKNYKNDLDISINELFLSIGFVSREETEFALGLVKSMS